MYRMLLLIATLMMGGQAAYADVRIGILMPLTGAGSRYGQEQRVAVDMFLEKYSDLGSTAGKLVPIIYDTRWSGTEAISVARKLIDSDQVDAIIGPQFSAEAEVAFPLAVRGETPMVTPMASPPGLARSRATMARDRSMPCTGTPRRASGSAIRPVPMPSSSARPPSASPASTLATVSTSAGLNMSSDGSS